MGAGDRAAGDALIGAHFASVCRFFRTNLGDDVEHLIQQTLAEILDIPERTVRSRLSRARQALREQVEALDQTPDGPGAGLVANLQNSLDQSAPAPD